MQRIRKILTSASEKTALPTNQPVITNNTDLMAPLWRRSKKNKRKIFGDIFFEPLFLLLQMFIFQTLICNEIINLLMIGEPLVYNWIP